MKTTDWSRLFEIRKTQSPNVELVKTPLEFPGTNDQVVVRVRKSPNGFLVDDGGDAEWFIETSGFSLEAASVETSKKHLHETLGVEFNDDFVLFQRVEKEALLPMAVIRVAQAAVAFYEVASNRLERKEGRFRNELKEALREVASEDGFEVSEDCAIDELQGQKADYRLTKKALKQPIYVFAASDKARLLEAQLAFLALDREVPVIAIAESQEKVGRRNFERAGYFTTKCLAYDKGAMRDLVASLH